MIERRAPARGALSRAIEAGLERIAVKTGVDDDGEPEKAA